MKRNGTGLSQLVGATNLYYAGLDDLPQTRLIAVAEEDLLWTHIAYIKILLLFADHIYIPPTFIAAALTNPARREQFHRHLLPHFQEFDLVTAVYADISTAAEYASYKMHHGEVRERNHYIANRPYIESVFAQLPVWHRDVFQMSREFRSTILENIGRLPASRVPLVDQGSFVEHLARSSDGETIALTREDFLTELRRLGLRPSHRTYHHLVAAMNFAYYVEGGRPSGSAVTAPNCRFLTDLGLFAEDASREMVGVVYDPVVIERILQEHAVPVEWMFLLTPEDIRDIRSSRSGEAFRAAYATAADVLLSVRTMEAPSSDAELERLRSDVSHELSKKFGAELDRYRSWRASLTLLEDLIMVALGTQIRSRAVGAAVSAAKSLFPGNPSDAILEKLGSGEAPMGRFLEYVQSFLRRRLRSIGIEEDRQSTATRSASA